MRMCKRLAAFCLCALLLITAAQAEDTAFNGLIGLSTSHDFEYGGLTRNYMLYVPEGIAPGAPLVFLLHGFGGFAPQSITWFGMNGVADRGGFAVVYPQGTISRDPQFAGTHWNADFSFSMVDDAGFLATLAEYLQTTYGFSKEKTFLAGISNGGFMCYTAAVETPGVFRAIASIAGSMSLATWEKRENAFPVPVLQVHGTADTVIPSDGSIFLDGGWGGAPPVIDILQFWAELSKADTQTVDEYDGYTLRRYIDAQGKDRVWYCLINGFGHLWPGRYNAPIDGAELIWMFFETVSAGTEGRV